MFKNKCILIFVLELMITGCVTVNIPGAYNFRVTDLQSNPFGCWMEICAVPLHNQQFNDTISGELLNMSSDSTYLLFADGVVRSFQTSSIVSASLYTHKNQSNTYFITTAILSAPSIIGALAYPDAAGGFLIFGAPGALVGFIAALIESSKKSNILVYPEINRLDDFAAFARYPGGIPENIDFRLLYLKRDLGTK